MFRTIQSEEHFFLNCLPSNVYNLIKDCIILFQVEKEEDQLEQNSAKLDDYSELIFNSSVVRDIHICTIFCSNEIWKQIEQNVSYLNDLEKAAFIMGCDELKLDTEVLTKSKHLNSAITKLNRVYKK